MRRIGFGDLRLDCVHQGCAIYGRVCVEQPIVMTSLMTLVALCSVLPPGAGPREAAELLPMGTRIAICNPLYKVYLDATSGIRVDNPLSVVILPEDGGGGRGEEPFGPAPPPQPADASLSGRGEKGPRRRGVKFEGARRRKGSVPSALPAELAAPPMRAAALARVPVPRRPLAFGAGERSLVH
ncbi:MAG: hypothetical protein J3K34DRAFT_472741 [Monoraphidium minutum]|nr:MAG: hypothetical protein J3K34DRAFT_472741 [Monoraphidium minutum]